MIGRLGFRGRRCAAYAIALVLTVWVLHALQGELCVGAHGLPGNRLVSVHVDHPPVVDGILDRIWDEAPLACISLARHVPPGPETPEVELRSLYAADSVYFFASWHEARPAFAADTIRNRFVMHFDQQEPWPGARDVTCLVACHTAFSDASGDLAHVIAETIPQGVSDPLPAAGGWISGRWHLEWSRPLVNDNPFDVQFQDLDAGYPFFVKVFEWAEGQADPVSKDYALVFRQD